MSGQKSILADSLQIKPSQLYVKDLQKVAAYYRDIVGLESLQSTNSHVVLGQGQVPILELISKPEFINTSIKNAGLFHNAIVFSSRAALSHAVLNILQKASWSYEGSADHLVSEAFYFHDPENNGLELYFDRPRDDWQWQNGNIKMDTLYLDPETYIVKNIHDTTTAAKELGHVHLRVGDIPTARKFYVDQLGFDTTLDVGSAIFVSVGGYHHHMAMNTWFSQGAGKRDPGLGLADIKLILPNDESINNLANRLSASNLGFTQQHDTLHVDDPWNNHLTFTTEK
jgi:catechol 2,3-dioxygenase